MFVESPEDTRKTIKKIVESHGKPLSLFCVHPVWNLCQLVGDGLDLPGGLILAYL